jgi:small conductance mechanosensitive channel
VDDAVDTVNRAAGPILAVLVVAIASYIGLRLVGRALTPVVMRRLATDDGDSLSRSIAGAEARKRIATVTALVDWVFRVLIVGTALLVILVALELTPVIVVVLVIVALVAVVARDVIRDYVAGVLIVLENQYAIGDWIRVGGDEGEVEALNLRRTLLRTMGGDLVSVPNGDIRIVMNRTRTWARINIEIGIADPSQLGAARAAIDRAGDELAADPGTGPSVIEPPRYQMVTAVDDNGIRLLIWGRIRATDRFAVEGAYRTRLLSALEAEGVSLVTAHRLQLVDHRA